MLQNRRFYEPASEEYVDSGGGFDLDYYFAVARRRAKLIVACTILGLLLGYGYLSTAVPLYTASVRVLIDSPEGRTAQELSGVTDIAFDTGAVDSQVELIRSETIAKQVVETLNLTENPLFMSNDGGAIATARAWLRATIDDSIEFVTNYVADQIGIDIGGSRDKSSEGGNAAEFLAELSLEKQAVGKIRENLTVRRVNRTFVLGVSYTSPSPQLAAQIANGYADVYINDQLESKYQATRRASEWLLNRTEELKQQSIASEQAVETFRKENDLVATSGTLISDQQLSGLNSQLILARAEVSKAQARHQRLNSIIENGDTNAVVSETLSQSITSNLRTRYLEASKKHSEISALLGSKHAQTIKLRNEMFQLQRLIFEELKRNARVAKSDLAVARDRVSGLENDLSSLVGATNQANETLIQLRELERNAESVRSLYTTFLQRYQESLQKQSFSISDARIITQAESPSVPSYPRRMRSLITALLLGGAAGVGFATLLEYRDSVFRTGDQVRDELGLEFIGMLPIVSSKGAIDPSQLQGGVKPVRNTVNATTRPADECEVVQLRPLKISDPVMVHATQNPLSGFAETLRSAKVAADLTLDDRDCKIVGIVSILPSEGKTTVAKNFASLIANQGCKALLIDGDVRNPGLTRACAGTADIGLLEVITENLEWQTVARREQDTGLTFLPTVVKRRVSHTSDLLSSPGMRALLKDTASKFDYIVVDLPPMGPVVDVRAILPHLDTILFVIEWGKTNRKMVRDQLADDPRLQEKALGVILNKVDNKKLKLYDGYHSKNYYYSRYKKYYAS